MFRLNDIEEDNNCSERKQIVEMWIMIVRSCATVFDSSFNQFASMSFSMT